MHASCKYQISSFKFSLLIDYLVTDIPDMIAITETWVNVNDANQISISIISIIICSIYKGKRKDKLSVLVLYTNIII